MKTGDFFLSHSKTHIFFLNPLFAKSSYFSLFWGESQNSIAEARTHNNQVHTTTIEEKDESDRKRRFFSGRKKCHSKICRPRTLKDHLLKSYATPDVWLFRVLLRVQGLAYRPVFTKSLHSLAVSRCDREIDEFSYSALIYRPHSQSHLTG